MRLKAFMAVVCAGLICLCSNVEVYAEKRTIEATGTYSVGDGAEENFAKAQARAKEDAMRSAAEQAGVYVESYSKTENMRLTQDEVRTIAAQVLQIEKCEIKAQIGKDGKSVIYTCFLRALVDTDKIDLVAVMEKRKTDEENERLKQTVDSLQQEINALKREQEELKRQYRNATSESEKQRLKKQIEQNKSDFDRKMTAKWVNAHIGTWSDAYGNEVLRISEGYINGCPVISVYDIVPTVYGKATVRIAEKHGVRDIVTCSVGKKFLIIDEKQTLCKAQKPSYNESISGIYLGMNTKDLRKLHGEPNSIKEYGKSERWEYEKLGVSAGIRNDMVLSIEMEKQGTWQLDRTGFNYANPLGQIYEAYQRMYPFLNKITPAEFNKGLNKRLDKRYKIRPFITIQTGPDEYLTYNSTNQKWFLGVYEAS